MNKLKMVSDRANFITLETACELTSLGKNTVRNLAAQCRAVRKIGKSYRINKEILLDYVDSFEG